MEIVSLPTSLAVGIAKDVADGGVIASRAMAAMDVNVMGGWGVGMWGIPFFLSLFMSWIVGNGGNRLCRPAGTTAVVGR